MKKRTALIMCRADPNGCPRPLRMIRTLKPEFEVTSLASAVLDDARVSSLVLPELPLHSMGRAGRVTALALRRYGRLLWSDELARLSAELRSRYDLVVCHDPDLLPLALACRGTGKLLFDAREYYPRHFEDRIGWRLLYRPMMRSICRTQLVQCDAVMTVSPGFAATYGERFGVQPVVVESVPPSHPLEPAPMQSDRVRLVHHGWANPSRRIELMIEMMHHVDQRYSLDLILMSFDQRYSDFLQAAADRTNNVRILPPVAYEDIIPTTNRYDVGVFLCPPTTFNLLHTIPNKLFEFIQARLAVAIGPLPDQSAVLRQHGCGLIAPDFSPASMADLLNSTESSAIWELKSRADEAAAVLNAQAQRPKIMNLVEGLLDS
jgi:hypothetical protein